MPEYERGIKAGIVAGLIYGIVYLVLMLALIEVLAPGFTAAMAIIGGSIIAAYAPTYIVGGIVGGLVFGVIYAFAYDKLPGATSIIKGIILCLLFWLVFGVGLSYGTVLTYPPLAILSLISSLIFGALLGVLWDKFGKK